MASTHLRFLGRVLDPGAVQLGVKRKLVEPICALASDPA